MRERSKKSPLQPHDILSFSLGCHEPRHLTCCTNGGQAFRDAVVVEAIVLCCGHQSVGDRRETYGHPHFSAAPSFVLDVMVGDAGELSNASADHNSRTVGEYAAQREADCNDHVLRYGDALISEVCRKLPILTPVGSVPMHQCAKASNGKNVVRTTSPHSCEEDTTGQSSHSLP